MQQSFQELQSQLKIKFHRTRILKQAFTHSSYVNEQRSPHLEDNERLEFLGDAVLELTVSEFLYNLYPDKAEGELTKLRAAIVCEPSLVVFAEQLHFGKYVQLGKGEEMTGGRTRPSLLADVFEAFIGALYLDQGLPAVQSFLESYVFPQIRSEAGLPQMSDYKTQLQEVVQRDHYGLIEYRIIEERGPAHEREFVPEVYIEHVLMGTGTGKSKKESEQQAAAAALTGLQEKK